MTTARRISLTLLIGGVLAAGVGAATKHAVPRHDPGLDTQWQRWQALTPAEQQSCVQTYREVARREDAATVLAQAREFGGLTDAERDKLRRLHVLMEETAHEQPASEHRWLLTLPPAARAARIYQLLVQEHPERLAAFGTSQAGQK